MCAEPDLRKWLARLLACLRHLRNDTIVSASWYAPVVMLNNALQQDSTNRRRVPHLSRGPAEAPPGPLQSNRNVAWRWPGIPGLAGSDNVGV